MFIKINLIQKENKIIYYYRIGRYFTKSIHFDIYLIKIKWVYN